MTDVTVMILLLGGTVIAFAFLGTYMAGKERADEKQVNKR